MARVDEKGIIRYASAPEYIEQYESNISQGGFYVESAADWPLRQRRTFAVYIGGTDTGVRMEAEVVFSQGNRLGLQIDPASAGGQALAALAEEMRSGAVLEADGTVRYRSATAFLVDFATNIAAGGFYLNSSADWQVGETGDFKLVIGGLEQTLDFRARVVMSQGGLVGLQLEYQRDNVAAFNQFVVELRRARKQQLGRLDDSVKEKQERQAERPRVFARPLQGLAVATREPDEFASVRSHRRLAEGATVSFFDLLLSVAAARQPLKLLIESNGDRHTLWFDERGRIVAYQGPRSDLDFIDRLLEAQFIDDDTRGQLRAELGGRQDAIELALERGAIAEQQALLIFRQQLVDVLERCRARGQLRFLVDPLAAAPERAVGVEMARLLLPWLERAFKALPAGAVKQMLKPVWNSCPVPVIAPPWKMEDLNPPAGEVDYLRRLDGQLSIKESLAGVDKSLRDRLIRLVLSMLSLGVYNAEGWGKLAAPPAAASKPAARPSPAAPGEDGAPAGDVDVLKKELQRLEEANLFERLGVHWSAHPNMFAVAMQELHRQYGPDSPLSRTSAEAARLCRERMKLAREALLVLQNPARRVEHRNQEVAVAIRAQSARLMEQKAEQQLNQQQPGEAVELLEMAYELDPTPECKTRLATVRRYYKT